MIYHSNNIRLTLTLLLTLFALNVLGQTELKVMSYNVLTYPESSSDTRADTLKKILDYYAPDLLLLQELKSPGGLADIVGACGDLEGNYVSGTYEAQISNPNNSWRLQQNIVYNESILELVAESVVTTNYRDVNYFRLYWKGSADIGTMDSVLFHVYVTHLKSSRGEENEALRLGMVEIWMNHIKQLPEYSRIIAAGDFNVYSAFEPAYQLLTTTNGTNTLYDPINMPGWGEDGSGHAGILTQSTRSSGGSGGAGGGLDDRFDFVLLSDALMSEDQPVTYIEDTYKALGNNGTCYNRDFLDCNIDNEIPYDILRSLWYMSDHLPVVLSLDVPFYPTALEDQNSVAPAFQIYPNPVQDWLSIEWSENVLPQDRQLELYDASGRLLFAIPSSSDHSSSAGVSLDFLEPGVYFIGRVNGGGMEKVLVF